jgi:protein-tyrosine phosphatase
MSVELTLNPLNWARCNNVRDVGGYPAAGGRQIRPRALVRADSLSLLDAAGRAALVTYGVRTIIDLRSADEVAGEGHPFAGSAAGPTDPAYLHLPFLPEDARTVQRAIGMAVSTRAQYRVMLDGCHANVAAIVRAFIDARPGPVLIHCVAGKDRTGLIVALLLGVAGVPAQAIAEDYAASAAALPPLLFAAMARVTRGLLGLPPITGDWRVQAGTMSATLDYLEERYGGSQGYLAACGLSTQELAAIGERLLTAGSTEP